jgi:large subunit ribosomal protein L24
MNAAKYARKLKHIRKVKAALRFQEDTRSRLKPIKEQNQYTKHYIKRSLEFNQLNDENIKTAEENHEEDWKLGPLRPNRAVGPRADVYGAMRPEEVMSPTVPDHWYGAKANVQGRMKTRIPENVCLDRWPIVEGDRVVVIRGPQTNKVGIVSTVVKSRNEVTIEGIGQVGHVWFKRTKHS